MTTMRLSLTAAGGQSSLPSVKFAKIQFEDRNNAAKALVGLAQRCRVVGLRDHVFIVPEPALGWLAENALAYHLIELLNQDDVIQALRNHPAHAV